MTTPDTAAVRSWAREQGLVVADRGRLPAEVVDAYAAAHTERSSSAPADRVPAGRKPGTTSSRPAAGKRTGKRAAAPGTTSVAPERAVQPVAPAGEERAAEVAVVPAPAAAEDDRRLAELVQQVAALSQRVAALEAAAAVRPARNRFRFGR